MSEPTEPEEPDPSPEDTGGAPAGAGEAPAESGEAPAESGEAPAASDEAPAASGEAPAASSEEAAADSGSAPSDEAATGEAGNAEPDGPYAPPVANVDSDPEQSEWMRSDTDQLERKALRGGGLNLVVQIVRIVIELGSLPILARLLMPEDFGAVAQATAVTGFLVLFKDLGLSVATVQRKTVTHGQVSALFWLNIALGILVALLVAGCAPGLYFLYDDIRPAHVALALSGIVVFDAAAAQHLALLRRKLRFGWLAAIQFLGVFFGIVAALIAAYAGWGFWAIVLRAAVTSLMTLVLAWVACGWRPGAFRRDQVSGDMVRFGGYVTGLEVVAHLTKNVDNVLIGRTWGAAALGLYTKAYSLLLLPLNTINGPLAAVAMPALSRVQDQPEEYRRLFMRGCRLALLAQIPIVAIAGVCTEDLVSIGLGNQWGGAVELFRALLPAGFAAATAPATTWVFVSSGHPKRQLKASVLALPVVVTAFLIGLPYGAVGVAWGYSIALCLVRIPTIHYAFQPTALSLWDLARLLARPAIATALASGAVLGLHTVIGVSGIVRLTADLCLFGLVYLGAVGFLPGGAAYRAELGEAWALLRRKKPAS